jgi:Predicted amidophosphoribosyltransferases
VFEPEFFCAQCRTPFLNRAPLDGSGLCRLCREGFTQAGAIYSYAAYEGRARQLIHLFKYEGMRPLGAVLGRWLLRALPRNARYDALAPAPMHWWKRFRRGFNHAELLAKELSRATGIPVLDCLQRRRPGAAQAGLNRSQRRRNVTGAFALRSGLDLQGKRMLLIDDVLTSGATLNALARVLRQHGAARVDALTLARTDRRIPAFEDFVVITPIRGEVE